jgi:hypothetical protein
MNITGLCEVIFGVENVADCHQFVTDYGLEPVGNGRFEALDGTAVVILDVNDPSLPAAMETGTKLRKTVYSVADQATLEAIRAELSRDREVTVLADGSLQSIDDMGFVLGFKLFERQPIDLPAEIVNAPGNSPSRGLNAIGTSLVHSPKPRTLSHIVYFVPDHAVFEKFYIERLGFVVTDRFIGAGPFMRPAGSIDHHALFCIQTPPFMKGIEHFTFHMAGPSDVVFGGTNMVNKGYESFWGPGRHIFGSNWFWYFKSPMGCNMEFDADMDLHDDTWTAREAPLIADNSQSFLLQYREKWSPGGPPPGEAHD